MARRGKIFILVLIVLVSVIITFVQNEDDGGPTYAPFTTNEMGASLFYDTLRHMGKPVRFGYAPLTATTDPRHVYVIIQPSNPHISLEMAEEILEWVRRGGRLILLQNGHNIMDAILTHTPPHRINGFAYHREGFGAIVTGQARDLANAQLMHNAAPAEALHSILTAWNAERIVFPVYYYGIRPPQTFFSQLPLVIRLVIVQLCVAALAMLWHVGKRFGRAVPLYEEVEREENEQVRALARLYYKL
ncbi:MAG: DUF4350 domain-containing protein [Defluviitaleaceae bacterium]|nr:DUF4350 domain-containing protein [Defluviitaleaceae bacterium]MCL2261966.1 DUF4350 domain-containing protein [Defluviitaleaceae bacterium]